MEVDYKKITMKTVDISKVHAILKKEVKNYKVPVVDLIKVKTKSPFKVLVATILSARTNDKTTTIAAKKLFTVVHNSSDLEKITLSKLENLIKPVGFYKNKAKHLKKLPKVLKEKFNNKIPETIDELLELPGVGRKTANLVVIVAFDKPAMCIDTHCHRIPQRLGWFTSKSPLETEMIMRKSLPKRYWKTFNSIFVAFGQNMCRPIGPHCWECPITKYCKYYRTVYKNKKR